VVILGRFTEERTIVLDALREKLRQRDLVPIIFDCDPPELHDLTEMVRTLAHENKQKAGIENVEFLKGKIGNCLGTAILKRTYSGLRRISHLLATNHIFRVNTDYFIPSTQSYPDPDAASANAHDHTRNLLPPPAAQEGSSG
jgi:hypothetical protein